MAATVSFVSLERLTAVAPFSGTFRGRNRLTGMTRKTRSLSRRRKQASSPDWFGVGMDAWMLGAEANIVIAMRMGAMAMGGPKAAAEAQRMVSEKVAASMALGMDIATGRHGSSPETIISGSIAHYSRKVRSNRRRLGK